MKGQIVLDIHPTTTAGFKPGQRGYFADPSNPLVIIGENDLYVYTILDNSRVYYGILKKPANLAMLHVV
jgi:hypothetical protein